MAQVIKTVFDGEVPAVCSPTSINGSEVEAQH